MEQILIQLQVLQQQVHQLKVHQSQVHQLRVHQLQVLVGVFLASFLAGGSISALYFAERLFELPLGLAGIAVGIAATPRLAGFAALTEITVASTKVAST